MKWTSVLAIYALFWVMSAFLLLPFGIKTHDEAGIEKIPGQADSAPANFRPGRVALRATVLAAVLCALFVANYVHGWIKTDDLDFFHEHTESIAEPDAAF
jgi:predicted secreted protein